ncbi:EAL domain-containing protein [Actinoplanes sp. NEAU-A12]|uniref:EAL domain-containing protein n=1 Tax=Actinoplanes sandaracinus TaxID=3045177 RepID=A0ABT6WR65_9ACTN|nr:EAL domain-containing protein [Actinoplanes sandaracinus]MDI6102232.1 EAL domain-containing protein [Actinoplanes sandaracinus]
MKETAPSGDAAELLRTRSVVSSAVTVLAVSMVVALVSYAWDWIDVLVSGDTIEPDEWLGLVGVAWLPLAAATTVRLVRFNRSLAARVEEAVEAFRDTVHTAHGWVWQVDADLRITYSSDGVGAMLGYDAREIAGRDVRELLDRDPADAAHAFDTSARQDWTSSAIHRDGTVRTLSSTATPVYGAGARLVGYRGFSADVTWEAAAASAEQRLQDEKAQIRARIEHSIRDAGALEIVLQPIVDLDRHEIAGMEALARFTSEPYRTPDVWFAEAWQVGLGVDLEMHAVESACRRLPGLPGHAYLAVNVSAQTILDPRFHRLLAGLGDQAARLVIEVTEHVAVDDYDTLAETMRRVRATGARLAVDDAGAGYASMQHILRLRPDIVKLDRSIIADSDQDPARRALIGAMCNFGTSLGVTVVAEGVETGAELAVLTEEGLHHAQGYYLSRPATDPHVTWPPDRLQAA